MILPAVFEEFLLIEISGATKFALRMFSPPVRGKI